MEMTEDEAKKVIRDTCITLLRLNILPSHKQKELASAMGALGEDI